MYRHYNTPEKSVAKPVEDKPSMAAQAPRLRNIVVGMTLELYSQSALEYYKNEIFRPGDRVIVVYCHKAVDVLPNPEIPKRDLENVGRQEAQRIQSAKLILEDRLRRLSLDGEVVVYLQEDPMTRLTEVAEEKNARLIVIGSRNLGPELGRILNSREAGIVQNSTIPILVWKPGLLG